MTRRSSLLLAPVIACLPTTFAQTDSKSSAEAEIRRTLDDFMAAARAPDGHARAFSYLTADATFYSPGGVHLDGRTMDIGAMFRNRAQLIRHVRLLTPDSAVAIGLWRRPGAKPPADAGTTDFNLVREVGGAWKIRVWRSASMMSPEAAAPSLTEPPVPASGGAAWESLFEGTSTAAWVTMNGRSELPDAWRVADGCLITVPGKTPMGLRTARSYTTFELSFEWAVPAKANSGVKYRLFAAEIFAGGNGGDGAGFEYQVADDDGDPGARIDPKQRAGALYGIAPRTAGKPKPLGEWNQSRILLMADRVEHWLNGSRTLDYPIDVVFPSPIALQHHNSEVRFRNMKIRPTRGSA